MKRCKQCGKARPDNGWMICAACDKANVAYREECERLARAMHHEFQKMPPARTLPREYRRPSERRGRKERPPILAPYLRETGDDE